MRDFRRKTATIYFLGWYQALVSYQAEFIVRDNMDCEGQAIEGQWSKWKHVQSQPYTVDYFRSLKT